MFWNVQLFPTQIQVKMGFNYRIHLFDWMKINAINKFDIRKPLAMQPAKLNALIYVRCINLLIFKACTVHMFKVSPRRLQVNNANGNGSSKHYFPMKNWNYFQLFNMFAKLWSFEYASFANAYMAMLKCVAPALITFVHCMHSALKRYNCTLWQTKARDIRTNSYILI